MKPITMRFVGHDRLMMEMVKNYFSNYSFIETKPILLPELFFKTSIPKKEDIIFVDLPSSSQMVYEFGIKLMKLYPGSMTIALGHRADIAKVLKLQHVNKFFHKIISRNESLVCLEVFANQLKDQYGIKSSSPRYIAFTNREKDIITLTCQELNNDEIASDLRISKRTVETHKGNIYTKLGSKHPSKLYKYALDHGMLR